jgi:hypothetical protein
MSDDQPGVRRKVVEALLRVDFARGDLTGPERELLYNSTEAERAAVAAWHAREATRLLQEAGVLKLPTALDLRGEDALTPEAPGVLADAEDALTPFWRRDMTLGEVLKVVDRGRADVAVRHLRQAGFREFDDWELQESPERRVDRG